MQFTNHVNQRLHEEHCATLALLQRLAQLIARHGSGAAPQISDGEVAQLLRDLCVGLETELNRHFDFEEEHLFDYLRACGDTDICAQFMDEHRAIRPVATAVAKLAREAATSGFDRQTWDEFRRLGSELCDRLPAHAEKEDMALLPVLEDGMDRETEARLLEQYLETA